MEENEQFELKIIGLIGKFIKNELMPDEQTELESWKGADSRNQALFEELISESSRLAELRKFNQYDENIALVKFLEQRKQENIVRLPRRINWRYAVAASILICCSIGGYFLLHKRPVQQMAQNQHQDLAPGGNRATLTLAGGKQVILTGAKNGRLAVQGITVINKTADGEIVYTGSNAKAGSETEYNTMKTPAGGKYNLTLSDGTKVWLNAASSVTYPTAFNGKERVVSITGEAYFEVSHNTAKPFKVTCNGQTVEVLGTHFNINAYTDEPAMKTTLLEGRVSVRKDDAKVILNPGQQSAIAPGQTSFKVSTVNTQDVVAWKDGLFACENTGVEEIMRQAARWYNVKVEYEGKIPAKKFGGTISRDLPASKFLEVLSYTGVKFKIADHKIIVTN